MSSAVGHGRRRTVFLLLLLVLSAAGCARVEQAPETGSPMARVETCRDLILRLDHAILEHDGPVDDETRIEERSVSMGGADRAVIFAHPTSEIRFQLRINPGAQLRFMIGLHPDCWETVSDGATFQVLVQTWIGRQTLFSRHLDPAHDHNHRGWQECVVDLQPYAGSTREIILRTGPGPADDPAFDWALWGEPQLVSEGRRAAADTSARPNVVLISLDTLRLDHLDACGHSRLTAPHLNRLLGESVFFTAAQAPSHWTMPSHMSVFTSLSPDIHQVTKPDGTSRLAADIPTLAGSLGQAGYFTAGFATCGFLKGIMGFDRGFDRYCLRYNNARRQNRLVRDWAWSNRDRNQFIFLHYFDVHSDYRTLPYDAPFGFDALWRSLEPEQTFSGCSPDGEFCASSYMTRLNKEGVQLEPAQSRAISVLYDRGIRQLDFHLAELVTWLKAQGLWDSSLVILFSDHGEEFQDHGKLLHHQLFGELISVPLIVKLPGGRHGGKRIATPVAIADIAPTILSLLEEPVPQMMQGLSLVPLIEGQSSPGDGEPVLFSWSSIAWTITRGEWKLIVQSRDDLETLYNLAVDPAEQFDVAQQNPEILDQLHRLLKEQRRQDKQLAASMSTSGSVPGGGFSDEERRRLELLGYVE